VADPLERLVAFGRALRAEGLPVGTGRIRSFCRAAADVGPRDLYWAGRATLVSRREDIAVYDRVFRATFGGDEREPPPATGRAAARVPAAHPPAGGDEPGAATNPSLALASAVELLKRKSFARCSPDELAQLAELMARIRLDAPLRRSRRRQAAVRGAPDLRRTLRRAFRTGGEPLERAWRERRRIRRRLVFVLDVSGSMTDYSRALLMFAHAALRADPRWEAFCFGTRLTRLTKALAAGAPDEALARAAVEVFDWDAGTRIGESLARLLSQYPSTVRGAVVVVCSDGLEVGDPELLRGAMARLARLAHAVVWLNPLREHPEYEPLARGMKTALPYVDVFAGGYNLASLEELGTQLSRI
jgi:uncharacterized protein with von Willebrand factor type A (vWA) domain